MDFSWKRYYVVVTHHELILALDKASDVSDRIPLAEIERVDWEHAKDAGPRKRGDKRVRHAPEPGDSGNEARGRGQRGGKTDADGTNGDKGRRRGGADRVGSITGALNEGGRLFELFTTEFGFNDGRAYALQAADVDETEQWVECIKERVEAAKKIKLQQEHRLVFLHTCTSSFHRSSGCVCVYIDVTACVHVCMYVCIYVSMYLYIYSIKYACI